MEKENKNFDRKASSEIEDCLISKKDLKNPIDKEGCAGLENADRTSTSINTFDHNYAMQRPSTSREIPAPNAEERKETAAENSKNDKTDFISQCQLLIHQLISDYRELEEQRLKIASMEVEIMRKRVLLQHFQIAMLKAQLEIIKKRQ